MTQLWNQDIYAKHFSEKKAQSDDKDKAEKKPSKAMYALLKMAECPDVNCCKGSIPHQVGEDSWEAQQCQWCCERDQAIAIYEKGE